MSYDEKYKIRTLEYRQKGHSQAQTSEVFNVAINTIRNWGKQLDAGCHLGKNTFIRTFKNYS